MEIQEDPEKIDLIVTKVMERIESRFSSHALRAPQPPTTLTRKESAAYLSISTTCLDNWRRAKLIEPIWVANRPRFYLEDVKKLFYRKQSDGNQDGGN